MSTFLHDLFEGKIDFEGQKTVEHISRNTLVGLTVVSYVLGLILQSLRVTVGTFGFGLLVILLVTVPPWPMFNKHPVQWLPVQETKKQK
ncbi:hypothetical protein EW146_g5048 [Bondarzewia mesenterica]|uniref:Signal peptidase complex subunit 1 n=1 Tax=Bondarzewia mesenterica TaxID=1095465 RepID=A0A4S4LUG3_9AGAM|nr:hypothetical protein EW146_g5048 [Bondarzewia mesenterica]